MTQRTVGPCVLDGKFVRLEPLRYEHVDALLEVGKSLDWEWFLGPLRSKEAVIRRIENGLERGEAQGSAVRFRRYPEEWSPRGRKHRLPERGV